VVDSPKLNRRGHDVAEHSCSALALALAPAIDFVVVQDSGSAATSVAVGDSASTAQAAQLVVECMSAVLEAECIVAVEAEQVAQDVRNAQEVV
jgi:DICT domain-containing protein